MPKEPEGRIVIKVHKQEPKRCPSCGKSVVTNNQHGYLLDFRRLADTTDAHFGVPVVCAHCHTSFALVTTEILHCDTAEEARHAIEVDGYVNPQAGIVYGDIPKIWRLPIRHEK